MAKYKRRPDGRYRTSVMLPPDPVTGKKKQHYVYGKTIAELERNKAKILDELDKGIYVSDKRTLFSDYKWKWLETYKASRSHNTIEGYRNILKNHVGNLDSIPLIEIKKSDVQEGYNSLTGHADLQRRYYQTVNQIMTAAIDDGLIYKNVATNITKEKTHKTKKRALNALEREHITIVDFTAREKVLAYLLLYTGMRRQEIIPLTVFDIDFKRECIRVNKAVEFVGEKARLKETKSDSGNRTIYLLEPLIPVLKAYIADLSGSLLFPSKTNEYMTKGQYRALIEAVKRKLNTACGGSYHWENGTIKYDVDFCEGLGSHTFRHEFATTLYYSGIDIMEAVNMMGHSDSKMLLDTYAELRKEERTSKNKLNNYIRKV